MFEVTLYGREAVVRSRVWLGLFHSRMYEVCDVSGGSRTPRLPYLIVLMTLGSTSQPKDTA